MRSSPTAFRLPGRHLPRSPRLRVRALPRRPHRLDHQATPGELAGETTRDLQRRRLQDLAEPCGGGSATWLSRARLRQTSHATRHVSRPRPGRSRAGCPRRASQPAAGAGRRGRAAGRGQPLPRHPPQVRGRRAGSVPSATKVSKCWDEFFVRALYLLTWGLFAA